MSSCLIRPIEPGDAEALANMAEEFNQYQNKLRAIRVKSSPMTSQVFTECAFGLDPAFQGLIAMTGQQPAGYVLYHLGFRTDRAVRTLQVIEMFVMPGARKNGIGTSLMSGIVQAAEKAGTGAVISALSNLTPEARSFFKYIGVEFVKDETMLIWPKEKWPR